MTFSFPVVPRYAEIDQQNVVFFGHYLTWCDEAFTAFQTAVGYPYPAMIADGVDIQIVHAELDYGASVAWGDAVSIEVENEKVGTTSMTTRFSIRRRASDAEPWADAVTVSLVHVCVDATSFTKVPVPSRLGSALAGSRG
ncbi:thioesterase family protein [Actinomycetospora sp. TBRC 11914]|uniref:acyl-CoA thioesterase n=1 Tax=Actinomycetospora sp. TBRC 11914 TaxID=2729387 RepID=UPI00145D12B3|nr:thioesterase family protein [Actinomycetospora sp. TBRC 11914]NMO88670.1 acyl-CoA thioesterase [Actinomycetospora sp. TBRC 11914]